MANQITDLPHDVIQGAATSQGYFYSVLCRFLAVSDVTTCQVCLDQSHLASQEVMIVMTKKRKTMPGSCGDPLQKMSCIIS